MAMTDGVPGGTLTVAYCVAFCVLLTATLVDWLGTWHTSRTHEEARANARAIRFAGFGFALGTLAFRIIERVWGQ